ncbi:MAG: hypothetical protein NDJ90_15995 [Oligoflexia bacterium]|nr:hypothetical protein [Oligoflexia bacterium]
MKFRAMILILISSTAFAAAENVTQQKPGPIPAPVSTATLPSAPRLSLSLKSYFYEMQGKRWALNNMYGFEDGSFAMQLLTATYALTPTLSVVAMGSYNRTYLETVFKGGGFNDTINGLSDTKLLLRQPVLYGAGHLALVEGGLSLPTGSIDVPNPRKLGTRLGYNLQLGSGTLDPMVAATYTYSHTAFTHGARAQATFRLADNKHNYHFGHEYVGTAWTDYRLLGSYLVPSLKFNVKSKRAIDGVDPAIGRAAPIEFYYHPQTNWDLTLLTKSTIPLGLAGASVAIEAGLPLLQDTINDARYHIDTEFYGSAGIQVAM